MTPTEQPRRSRPRYRLVCVADLPDKGATDDLDEAMLMADAHYEVYDTHTHEWLGPTCQEEVDEARARMAARDV